MQTLLDEMILAARQSCNEMRARVSNVRLGPPGTILFDCDGRTFATREPMDVIVATDVRGTNNEASRSWALTQLLAGNATPLAATPA